MAQGLLKVKGVSIQSVTADPSGAADGDIIYRSDLGKFRMREAGAWKDVGSSAISWGAITGTLSDQTDLQSALDSKANSSDVTDLVTDLASTDTGDGASTIGVEDSSGRFTGTDVESVLAEIGLALEGLPATYLPTAGGQMSGTIDMNSNAIENVPAPTDPNHAVNKTYVDNIKSATDLLIENLQFLTMGSNTSESNLGAFTGGIIPDDIDIKTALQSLETAIEGLPNPLQYKGTWNASTNSPTLANADTGKDGWLYQVTVAGSVDFGAGSISFEAGDKVVNNGTVWEKWDMTDAVTSVNGQSGAVVLALGDLDDINAPSPSDGYVLTWDNTNSEWIAAAAAAGANTALSNLASTAVNVSLIPGTNNSVDLGSSSLRWKDLNLSNKIVGPNNRSIDFSNASYGALESFGNDVVRWDSSGLAIGNTLSIYNNNSHSIKCIESQGIYKTIAANITTPTLISGMSYPIGTYSGAVINYTIVDTNSGRVRTGRFIVSCDASNIDFADQFAQSQVIGDVSSGGTELTAAINGGNFEIRVNRTHATNGCTLKGVITLI